MNQGYEKDAVRGVRAYRMCFCDVDWRVCCQMVDHVSHILPFYQSGTTRVLNMHGDMYIR